MKRFVALLTVLILCICLVPTSVFAADYTYTEFVPCKYDLASGFGEDELTVVIMGKSLNQRCGYINKSGQEVIPCKYVAAGPFREGLANVETALGSAGFIDKTGKIVIPCIYASVGGFSEGLAAVRKKEWDYKYGFIDKTGAVVIQPINCEYVGEFHEGLVSICIDYKWGFLDRRGNIVIPCSFDRVKSFENGVAEAVLNGKTIYIDKAGNEVPPNISFDYSNSMSDTVEAQMLAEHDYVLPCGDGFYYVIDETYDSEGEFIGKYGVVDKYGKEIIPCVYDRIEYLGDGLFARGVGVWHYGGHVFEGKYAIVDKQNKEIVPCIYNEVEDYKDGIAVVVKDGKFGYIRIEKMSEDDPPASNPTIFTDVKAGDYFAESVVWAYQNGITNGTSANTFSPNKTCSYQEIITMIWRANGRPKPTSDFYHYAVPKDTPYFEALCWSFEKGLNQLMLGGPEGGCTRYMAVYSLWETAGSPEPTTSSLPFVDVDIPGEADAKKAIAWAVEKGITYGTSATTFSPNAICSRAEIVTLLYRGLDKK